jgi:hypothetical protein
VNAEDVASLRVLFEGQPELGVARAEVEPTVVRWAWSKDEHLSPGDMPMANEMSGRAAPPLLGEPPAGTRFAEYGFDAADRCVIARRWVRAGEDGNLLDQEQLLRYAGDQRIAALYEVSHGASASLVDVTRRRYDAAGALVSHECFHRYGGYWAMEYAYEAGHVMERALYTAASMEAGGPENVDEVVRNDAGLLVAVRRGGDVVWSAPTTRLAPARVPDVQNRLERDIRGALDTAEGGPWWIVMIRYTADGDWADAAWPTLSLVSAADRATITGLAHANGSWRAAWDWLDWTVSEHEVEIPKDTQDALDALDGEVDVEEVPKVLRAIASRLSTGLDAIVVACDWELVDLDDGLKVLTPGKLEELRAAGIAP